MNEVFDHVMTWSGAMWREFGVFFSNSTNIFITLGTHVEQ